MKRLLFVLTLLVALFLSGTTNKRVAVMEIGVDKTSKQYFKQSQLEAATQYFYSKLAGKMNIINQTQLKEVYQEMVTEGRVKSRKRCVDDACRIELGRNAAANYNMNSRITAFAGSCTLTVELINLRTTMSEEGEGASANFKCNVNGLRKSIDDAFFREKQVQGWSRNKKEALINKMTDKLHELARCMNESHHKNFAFDSAQAPEEKAKKKRWLSGVETTSQDGEDRDIT